jgi:hypothetical protein
MVEVAMVDTAEEVTIAMEEAGVVVAMNAMLLMATVEKKMTEEAMDGVVILVTGLTWIKETAGKAKETSTASMKTTILMSILRETVTTRNMKATTQVIMRQRKKNTWTTFTAMITHQHGIAAATGVLEADMQVALTILPPLQLREAKELKVLRALLQKVAKKEQLLKAVRLQQKKVAMKLRPKVLPRSPPLKALRKSNLKQRKTSTIRSSPKAKD